MPNEPPPFYTVCRVGCHRQQHEAAGTPYLAASSARSAIYGTVGTRLPISSRHTTREQDTQTRCVITRSICGSEIEGRTRSAGRLRISSLKSVFADYLAASRAAAGR